MAVSLRGVLRRGLTWLRRGVSLASEEAARVIFGVQPTLSGVQVTERSALESPEYFAGVRNVSEDLATLPLITYRRLDARRREEDQSHPLHDLLYHQPNEEVDSVTFIEMMQAWLMMRRNSYAEIQRTGGGGVAGLWPIPPSKVWLRRINGQLVYQVTLPDGEQDPVTGQPYSLLDRSRVFHLRAFALDGLVGESSITLHQEAIGLALALDRYGAAFFGNDATPGGVYELPTELGDQAYARMKKELEEPHRGLARKHRLQLLEGGMKFHAITVENDKAQFVDSKRHSAEQMARLNRVPPHKIGDLSRATFSNIEHQGIDYVVSSIRPWAVRWERAILTQLFTRQERRTHFAEFLLDALLRGDSKSRADTLAVWRQNGIINGDEWRQLENLNEIGDGSGKVYLVNGNMVPIDQAGRNPAPSPTSAPARMDVERVFRPLLLAAAERCVRKEAAALAKAAERLLPAKGVRAFEEWVGEFYGEQEATIRQAFLPLAVAVGEALRGPTGPDLGDWAQTYVRSVAGARLKAAREELHAVVASGSSDLVGAVRALAERWVRDEPDRLAEREGRALVASLTRYLQEQAVAA